jgi:hypothetical protein
VGFDLAIAGDILDEETSQFLVANPPELLFFPGPRKKTISL